MYKFFTEDIDHDDISYEGEVDFLALGDNHVENILWLRDNDITRKFEIPHHEFNKFMISLKETSFTKKYEVNVNGKKMEITKFRNVEFPFFLPSGPALIALSLRDQIGNAVSPAILIEYDINGSIIDCVLPENQIYYIHNDPFSPCYIVRENQIVTLPINPSQYLKIMEFLDEDVYDDLDEEDIDNSEIMEAAISYKWF